MTAIRDKCKSVSTAKRVVSHIGEVLKLVEAEGLRVGNPCPTILAQVKTPSTKHREWIPANQMIPWMQVIAESHYPDVIRRMVRFLHFLPMRLDEVREMRWEEVSRNVWTIPAKRMKARTPFRVILPEQARALMGDVRKEGFCVDFVRQQSAKQELHGSNEGAFEPSVFRAWHQTHFRDLGG